MLNGYLQSTLEDQRLAQAQQGLTSLPEWNPEMEPLLQLGLNAGGHASSAMIPYQWAKSRYQAPADPNQWAPAPIPFLGGAPRGLLDPRTQTPEFLNDQANRQDQYRQTQIGKTRAEHATKSANVKAPKRTYSTGEKIAGLLWAIAMLGGADPRFGMGVFQNWQQGRQAEDDEFVATERQKLDAEYQGKLDALGAGAIGTKGLREKGAALADKNDKRERMSLAQIQTTLKRGMDMDDRAFEAEQAARIAGVKAKTDSEKLADDRYEKLRDDYTNLAEAYGGAIPKNEVDRLNQDVKRLVEGSGRTYSYFNPSGAPTRQRLNDDADNRRADAQLELDREKFKRDGEKLERELGIKDKQLALDIAKFQAGQGDAPDARAIAKQIAEKRGKQANLKAQAKAIEAQINAFGKNLHQLPEDQRSQVVKLREQQRQKLVEASGLEGEIQRLAVVRQSSTPRKPNVKGGTLPASPGVLQGLIGGR